MQLWRSEEKHVIPEARGVFPNYRSCSNKGYYLPLESFSFPSWIKITKSSMINFPIHYFPSLSAFSWPLAFLPGCKTWAAALDKSLRTQKGWNRPKLSQKFSNDIWDVISLGTVRSKDQGGSWGASATPPHLLSVPKVWEAEANPSRSASQAVPGSACTGNGWEHTKHFSFSLTLKRSVD